MLYAWYEVKTFNNTSTTNIYLTSDSRVAPPNSVTVPDGTTLNMLTVVNGSITFVSESILLYQSQTSMTAQLAQQAQSYITQYYPFVKQQSDVVDINMANAYLSSQTINTQILAAQINNLTIANYPSFTTSFTSLLASYSSYTSNSYVVYWLEEVLKAAYRTYFTFLVKNEYSRYVSEIMSATSLTQLQSLSISYTTPFPAGL